MECREPTLPELADDTPSKRRFPAARLARDRKEGGALETLDRVLGECGLGKVQSSCVRQFVSLDEGQWIWCTSVVKRNEAPEGKRDPLFPVGANHGHQRIPLSTSLFLLFRRLSFRNRLVVIGADEDQIVERIVLRFRILHCMVDLERAAAVPIPVEATDAIGSLKNGVYDFNRDRCPVNPFLDESYVGWTVI